MTKQETAIMTHIATFAFKELDAQPDVWCAKRSQRTQDLQAQWTRCVKIMGRKRALVIADQARKT